MTPPRKYVSPSQSTEEQFQALQVKIFSEHGLDCTRYKPNYLKRRIAARMRSLNIDTYAAYARFLDRTEGEYAKLQDKITVNVTEFFRDGTIWDYFGDVLLPAWWTRAEAEREARRINGPVRLRIWSAGCSSGEEPYSIAALVNRFFKDIENPPEIQVLATDLDPIILERAKKGFYPSAAIGGLSAVNRQSFEKAGDELIKPRAEVKRLVTFRKLDLISDQYPKSQHFIFCRNVMIYFSREQHTELFKRFDESLSDDGYLIIGKTETMMGSIRDNFRCVSAKERVFTRV